MYKFLATNLDKRFKKIDISLRYELTRRMTIGRAAFLANADRKALKDFEETLGYFAHTKQHPQMASDEYIVYFRMWYNEVRVYGLIHKGKYYLFTYKGQRL